MKERFSKLLLGEDMSGGGKGVCTAVTISNSITNLYGNFFILVENQYESRGIVSGLTAHNLLRFGSCHFNSLII